MSLISLTSSRLNHNSKLFFSKYEFNLILSCYSIGVSRGNWKDYSINYKSNEAIFCFYEHTLVTPEYALIKFKKNKKNKFFYSLKIGQKNKENMTNIDKIINFLKSKNIKVIK